MTFSFLMYNFIAILSIFNFARILAMLLGSDLYDIRELRKNRNNGAKPQFRPKVSVIIPAYNEEVGAIRTIASVLANTYTNYEVIMVDDGSSDKTAPMVREYFKTKTLLNKQVDFYLGRKGLSGAFRRRYIRNVVRPVRTILVRQENGGKGSALNNAIKNYASGELVMVVDADSLLHPLAIERMANHFRDPQVMAAASNVKIIPSKSLLGFAQRLEYLISYRMKRSLTVLSMEYIIGGVGSTFRREMLLECNLYDTDTMTEDIDLTLKMIKKYGNKNFKVHYAADVLSYTEHVLSFKSLVKQRYRWKYGRFQSLLKNKSLFFSRSSEYSKQLTWYQLPYALIGEIVLLLEPLLVMYIVVVAAMFLDITSLLYVYVIVSAFVFLMIAGEESESFKSKLGLTTVMPVAYFLMYILTAVEFLALIKSIRGGKKLLRQEFAHGSWEHVERAGGVVVLPASS